MTSLSPESPQVVRLLLLHPSWAHLPVHSHVDVPQVLYLDLSYLTHDLFPWLQLPPTSTTLPSLFLYISGTCQITCSHSHSTSNQTRSQTGLLCWVQLLFLQPPSPKPIPRKHRWLSPLFHVAASKPPESPTRLPPSTSLYDHGQKLTSFLWIIATDP